MGPALLVEQGWAGFPCLPGTKKPAWPRGVHDATFDPDRLSSWWNRHRTDNAACATGASGLVVVDLDVKHGHNGITAFGRLCDRHGQDWPATFTTTTPSGGVHLFFTGSTRSTIGRLGEGIDVKSASGYVLVPDSGIHGRPYQVTADRPITPAPAWLIAANEDTARASRAFSPSPHTVPVSRERQRRWALAALDGEARIVAQTVIGHRNDALYLAALRLGSIAGAGLLELDEITAALGQAAIAAGLDPDEITPTIQSGYRTGYTNPRKPA